MTVLVSDKVLAMKLPVKSKLLHGYLLTLQKLKFNSVDVDEILGFLEFKTNSGFYKKANKLRDVGLLEYKIKEQKIYFKVYEPKDSK